MAACLRAGFTPRLGQEAPRITSALSLVAVGLGVSLVPEMVVARSALDVIVRPLNPPLTRTLALIQHRSKHDDRALQIVRNALLELKNLPD